jgi:quercetin dioxygenase-like cupin family protein
MTKTRLGQPLAVILLLIALLGPPPVFAREPGLAEGVTKQELSVEPLAGDPSKEVVTDVYSIPPGAVLPWHIHPDAHEISYVLSGELTLEIEGESPKHLKAGKSFYLQPNQVHRGLNEGDTPVKLFVVRIKPVDKPETVEVEPGKSG